MGRFGKRTAVLSGQAREEREQAQEYSARRRCIPRSTLQLHSEYFIPAYSRNLRHGQFNQPGQEAGVFNATSV